VARLGVFDGLGEMLLQGLGPAVGFEEGPRVVSRDGLDGFAATITVALASFGHVRQGAALVVDEPRAALGAVQILGAVLEIAAVVAVVPGVDALGGGGVVALAVDDAFRG